VNEGAFTKRYASAQQCAAARFHYDWLAAHVQPLCLPRLLATGRRHLIFGHVHGRYATPVDLEALAAHLGDAHGTAWVNVLHTARLDYPHRATGGHTIADFATPRLAALNSSDRVTTSMRAQEITRAIELIHAAIDRPAAIYKDTNPRNVLITPTGRIMTIDFADLTLAPFGYDLAKLVVTLSMTHGSIAEKTVERALAAYNAAAARHASALGDTSYAQLLGYAQIHHVLTARYLGRGGYQYQWPAVRPGTVSGGTP